MLDLYYQIDLTAISVLRLIVTGTILEDHTGLFKKNCYALRQYIYSSKLGTICDELLVAPICDFFDNQHSIGVRWKLGTLTSR